MEELNMHMESLDTMIDDLQKFQHEFTVENQQAVWRLSQQKNPSLAL